LTDARAHDGCLQTDVFSKNMEKEPLEPYPALRFVTKGLIPTPDSTAAGLADPALLDVIAPAPPPSGNRTVDLLVLQERAVRTPPQWCFGTPSHRPRVNSGPRSNRGWPSDVTHQQPAP
jgi:hypothetical protein